MKKLSIVFFALIFISSLQAQSSKTFNVDDFSGISISNSADVIFSIGTKSVSVSGPQELIDRLDVNVHKNSLNIENKKGKSGNWSGRGGLTFKISAPSLTGIVISGSGDLTIEDDFEADDFGIVISGSGDVLSKGNVTASKVSIVISGSGDVNLKGSCNKQSIAVSGSGDLDTQGLKCREANVVNSGSADIEVFVSEKISVVNSGSGDIQVKGSPEKKSIINTGSGDIDYR